MSVQLTISDADLPTVMDVFRSYGIDFAISPASAPDVATQAVPVPVIDPELVRRLEHAAALLANTLSGDTVARLVGAGQNLAHAAENLGGRRY